MASISPNASINTEPCSDTEWYLAIGSMINPVSLQLRKLKPIRSYAARADGWKLVFKVLQNVLLFLDVTPTLTNNNYCVFNGIFSFVDNHSLSVVTTEIVYWFLKNHSAVILSLTLLHTNNCFKIFVCILFL